MNKAGFVAGLLALGVTLTAMPALAATHDGRPKILLHVKSTTSKNPCTFGSAGITDCSNPAQITPSGPLIPVGGPGYIFIYLLVARGTELNIAGLQCGVYYQDGGAAENGDLAQIDIFGWLNCATLEFITPGTNAWPRPGGGNLITWDSSTVCQTGEVAVAGYFYAAAYNVPVGEGDVFSITRRPVDNAAKVANCTNAETLLMDTDLGWAAFSTGGTTAGCNPCMVPCEPVPVEPTTWGGIKTLFDR